MGWLPGWGEEGKQVCLSTIWGGKIVPALVLEVLDGEEGEGQMPQKEMMGLRERVGWVP